MTEAIIVGIVAIIGCLYLQHRHEKHEEESRAAALEAFKQAEQWRELAWKALEDKMRMVQTMLAMKFATEGADHAKEMAGTQAALSQLRRDIDLSGLAPEEAAAPPKVEEAEAAIFEVGHDGVNE